MKLYWRRWRRRSLRSLLLMPRGGSTTAATRSRFSIYECRCKITDGLVEVINVGQYLAHHKGMMRGEASLQSIPECGQFGAKAAPSQLRQDLRVGAPADQRIEHRPS